jgi:hypothetical protein
LDLQMQTEPDQMTPHASEGLSGFSPDPIRNLSDVCSYFYHMIVWQKIKPGFL